MGTVVGTVGCIGLICLALSFKAPSQEQLSTLSNTEAIAYVNAEDDGSITLIGVDKDGNSIELAKGSVISE